MPLLNWNDDDALMRDLGEALRPTPPEQVAPAQAAFAWRTASDDFALAELVFDSQVCGGALVRGPSSRSRMFVFGADPLQIEIELTDNGIEGQLIPPCPGQVRLLPVCGPPVETTADEVGCFTFPAPLSGPIRIECTVAEHRLATEWMPVEPP
jgi:hypothetical protein